MSECDPKKVPYDTAGVAGFPVFCESQSRFLGLFPHDVLSDLKNETSSVQKRLLAVNEIQSGIERCEDELLVENLSHVVHLVTAPLDDPNFKVLIAGLQLIDHLIDKVGDRIAPYLALLISSYLGKVGSNKYAVKQAGMRVLAKLMDVVNPWSVVSIVAIYGLKHPQTKVREETLNIITSSLLTFPAKSFKLPKLVEITAPLLVDNKQRVRQACLETLVVLSDRMGKQNSKLIISTVSELEGKLKAEKMSSSNENLSILDAYLTRLDQKQLPTLNSDGLVDHMVKVDKSTRANVTTSSSGTMPDPLESKVCVMCVCDVCV